jgi:hypothetical protein
VLSRIIVYKCIGGLAITVVRAGAIIVVWAIVRIVATIRTSAIIVARAIVYIGATIRTSAIIPIWAIVRIVATIHARATIARTKKKSRREGRTVATPGLDCALSVPLAWVSVVCLGERIFEYGGRQVAETVGRAVGDFELRPCVTNWARLDECCIGAMHGR